MAGKKLSELTTTETLADSDLVYVVTGTSTKTSKGISKAFLASIITNGFQLISEKDAVSGYAGLDGSGKINSSQLPAIAITDTFVVASEAAMLALTVEVGDVAVRTDIEQTFILRVADATVLANWTQLQTPTDAVSSVFGRSGVVTAQTNDYTWLQVNKATSSLADIATRNFADLQSKPTTIGGYGITDFNSLGDARWLLIAGTAANSTLFDSLNSGQFLRSDISGTLTGTLTTTGNIISQGTGNNSFVGSLGIGTAAPSAPIQVVSTSGSIPALGAASSHAAIGSSGFGTMIGTKSSGSGYIQQQRFDGTATAYDLLLQPNGGNLGIGTTSPDAKLHVDGTIKFTSSGDRIFLADGSLGTFELGDMDGVSDEAKIVGDGVNININNAGTETLRCDDNNRVGIGTTVPGYKLDVSGTGRFTSNLTVQGDVDLSSNKKVKYDSESDAFAWTLCDLSNAYGMGVNAQVHAAADESFGNHFISGETLGYVPVRAKQFTGDKYINQRVAWNAGFAHTSNNASFWYFIPVCFYSEVTYDTYYNNWIAPYAGRVKKVVMTNIEYGTLPTSTTIQYRFSVNGTVVFTTALLTISGTGYDQKSSYTLTNTDVQFNAGDRVTVAYNTDGLLQNVSTGISIEYTE